MKKYLFRAMSIACLHSLLFSGCKKPEAVQFPLPATPTPTSSPQPTVAVGPPTVSSAPSSSPTAHERLAPEGVFYVVTAFSLKTDSGIHGFSKGKKVTLLREEGNQWVVSDGIAEAKAPKTSFTNNLDVAETLLSKEIAVQKVGAQQAAQSVASNASKDADLHKLRQQSVLKTKIQQAKSGVEVAEQQIKALNDEIQSLRPKYGTLTSTGWVMKQSWNSSPTKQRDEQLIEALKIKQNLLRQEISIAESALREVH
ncbi:MAG: hypothetical protein ACOYM3_03385 [Terrimicrobiaceae bacterium]